MWLTANEWSAQVQDHERVRGQIKACVAKKGGQTIKHQTTLPVDIERRKLTCTEGSFPLNSENYTLELKPLRPSFT